MSYSVSAALCAALLSSAAFAQDSTVSVDSQAIIPQVATASNFSNEISLEGFSISSTEATNKPEKGPETTKNSTIVKTVPSTLKAKFGFGDFVLRPTLSLDANENGGSLALGHTFGLVEAGLGASVNVTNTKTKVEGFSDKSEDGHANVVFAYGILKPQLDGYSLEVEGKAGYYTAGSQKTAEPETTINGFVGNIEARVFVDVTPQLALGVAGGVDYLNTTEKVKSSESKVSKVTWQAKLANIRYSF